MKQALLIEGEDFGLLEGDNSTEEMLKVGITRGWKEQLIEGEDFGLLGGERRNWRKVEEWAYLRVKLAL